MSSQQAKSAREFCRDSMLWTSDSHQSNIQPQVGHKEISLTENKQPGWSIQITLKKKYSHKRIFSYRGLYLYERISVDGRPHWSINSKVKNMGSTTRHSQGLLLRNTVQC